MWEKVMVITGKIELQKSFPLAIGNKFQDPWWIAETICSTNSVFTMFFPMVMYGCEILTIRRLGA